MPSTRRKFIQQTALISSGLMLGNNSLFAASRRIKKFGIQLYTLRDIMPDDPQGVLRQLAGFGYKYIESYEGPKGIFWGMKHTDFKKFVEDLGMKLVSSHCAWDKDLEKRAAQAGEIGMKYLLCPYLGAQKTLDDYKRFADRFNASGEICKKNGLRFGYHNHDYSFKLLEGQYPQDVMMQGTDPGLVDFEMDMYWVVDAGQDPSVWLQRYAGRFKLCHIKDKSKTPDPKETNNSCSLGRGIIDFSRHLSVAANSGMECYLVEQERYESTPMQAVSENANYLKNLVLEK